MSKTEAKTTKKKTAGKKKVVKKSAAAGKPAASKKKAAAARKKHPVISPRERYEMIATMAYYRAEQRNFSPGHDVQDWLDCEQIIDGMLTG